jgi:hypothetical protein
MLINEVVLHERYINLMKNDVDQRMEFRDEVWNILKNSYAGQGGLISNGFQTPDHMVHMIAMWELVRRNGRIIAVKMYKDKGGRKSVAAGTDGTPEGKAALAKIMYDDAVTRRSYSEVSDNIIEFARRKLGDDVLEASLVPAEIAKTIDPSIELIPGEKYKYLQRIGPPGAEVTKEKYMLGNHGVEFYERPDGQVGVRG